MFFFKFNACTNYKRVVMLIKYVGTKIIYKIYDGTNLLIAWS